MYIDYCLIFHCNAELLEHVNLCPCVVFLCDLPWLFLVQFALPHIMGWDRLTTPLPGTLASKLSKVDPQMPDLEWDK